MAQRNTYYMDISHDGLNKYRRITGADKYVVHQKAEAQRAAWEEQWRKKKATLERKRQREQGARDKQRNLDLAAEMTRDAEEEIEKLRNILKHTLDIDDTVDWESLKDHSGFDKRKPALIAPPDIDESAKAYNPEFTIWDHIIPPKKKKKIAAAQESLEVAKRVRAEEQSRREQQYQEALPKWEAERDSYYQNRNAKNAIIDKEKQKYEEGDAEAIIGYCDMVLSNSEYPDYFPQEFELDYIEETKMIIVEYSLPSVEMMPKIKEVKYVQSKAEFREVYLKEAEVNKVYDNVLYEVCLRTIHELFEADQVDHIESIIFNGWVKSIDKATGQEVNACVLTMQAGKEEFLALNLDLIDAKACFRKFKGVGSSKLHSLTPVAPILTISKEDKRFTSSYDVADTISEGDNLAALPWEDFEHLIREIFEKEFSIGGGEVKVTRASRDGGVDAVAFDPDPIRGGKIVIQAKRYTNVVGVSAVRDLYGTVMNEGANKGILVTTAQYGPDAYEFARGKPLSLLDGSNLLHLLGKHGHKAKIDLKEAKQILASLEK